jgi:aryl-alcohol dehydrogenase-like predicted oxidoreductase/predicted kinase
VGRPSASRECYYTDIVIGLGCMRLSTERDRDEARALDVLRAALDGGVTLFDTADAYCRNEHDVGHNERLIARALAAWSGDRSRILVATKGGMTRPDGRWAADGRAVHLRAACEASLRALGVERIQLYQLHAPDPRTALATSVRALAALQRDGLVERIGLCNVTVGQIEEASRIADIAAVQVELSLWNDDNVASGVVEYCLAHGIRLLAYRALGGPPRAPKTAKDPTLVEIAARHDATPQDIALGWLADLSDLIVPLPGATRVETVTSIVRANGLTLTDADRAQLAERFPAFEVVRHPGVRVRAHAAPPRDGEVVLIMGLPGAGKTTVAQTFVAQGYARVNRDEDGGSLRDLLPELDRLVESGCTRIVLDNTYVSRKSRAPVVQAAEKAGLPVRCVWLSTGIEDAQVNAVWRMLSKYGRLLTPDEMRRAAKRDVNAFGPSVQFRYQRALEPPDPSERFSRIDRVAFERVRDPANSNRAVIVWLDDEEMSAERAAALRRYAADGWRVLGLAWRPAVGDDPVAARQADAEFAGLRDRLGVAIDVKYCPHGAGPPVCWCRKPLPGLGVAFIMQYRLDASQCIYIGSGPQDSVFARRLGFQFLGGSSASSP